MHFYDDDKLSTVSMTPEEVCRMAAMNLARIHEVAAAQIGEGTNVEAGLAVLHMTANLCFPATYSDDAATAISMVEEVLSLLPKA